MDHRSLQVLAALILVLSIGYAAPSSEYIIPAISREVFLVNVSSITNASNVYVTVYTNEQNLLSLLEWADQHKICTLASNNDWLLPIVTYSSDSDLSQRVKSYTILESGTYTFSNCYYPNTSVPVTIQYPRILLVSIGALDTFNSEYNTFSHYVYVYQPYPIYDDFVGSTGSWNNGCRTLNIPTSSIEPFLLVGSNLLRPGSANVSDVTITHGSTQSNVPVFKLFQFSDVLPWITGKLGIGWQDISTIDSICYSGTPGDIYFIMVPRW